MHIPDYIHEFIWFNKKVWDFLIFGLFDFSEVKNKEEWEAKIF